MKNLPSKEQRCVDAAEGWLGLGNWREANEEIENITPQFRAHPFVLEMRYKIYSAADRWDMAVDVAMGLREILPDNQWGHFYTAYALHELKLTQDAYNTLKPVLEKFPDHFLMRYNFGLLFVSARKIKGITHVAGHPHQPCPATQ